MTVQPFRLTDAAFAALGAGRPGKGTLDALRRAEHSRNLLLLRQLRRQVSDTPEWYAGLRAVPPEEAARWTADPMTGLWATHALRTASGSTPPPAPPGGHLLTATCEDLTLTVRLEDAEPVRARLGLTPAGPVTPSGLEHWRTCLEQAWARLVRRHRPAAEILAAVLRVIVPVELDPSAEGISATSAEAFGAVAMSAPPGPGALAAGLVHEIQHSLLNATHLLFDLVKPDGPVGYSPWRDDPRPAFGVLHGAYAYLAVTRFHRSEPGPMAAFEFARRRTSVADAAEGLLRGGELTRAGTRFVRALLDEVRPWLDEPVEPETRRLADLANNDHRVRWRLRNLTVTEADTARLVHAWRAGEAPPAAEAVLAAGSGRALENSPRLPLVRALVKGEPAAGAGADQACVRGDDGAAVTAYQRELGVDRGNESAWSGLALVSPSPALRRRPEVVRAVARAVPEAEIGALADWLPG
ncbi:HEXXH motif-containing putative peptide modification protein [Actinoplanes sp. NEAU-A12]|uniref:HEXXH motif-containing putative peptide modification protein n=1 Tax=Actinoplanes sandaracinus TaxID=3045177 RepID=A0ABT6WZY8_9ACTN|nr:HEXXH motif-containing putative peptide modification protein [Actinoplanes sandaracinus]MDI6105308.1 HEXXH motif-containing putative peptide modification protein [Actinoplanes sandaracinus]